MKTLVELRAVSKTYGAGDAAVHALVATDLSIRAGEVVLIEGPSGSGKTTLLSILGLVLRPSSGAVYVGERCVTVLAERDLPQVRAETFGFVFQNFNLFAALNARENVALAMRMKGGARGGSDMAEADRLLELVGLSDRRHHLPGDMSGGQKQRVAIARALSGNPPVILGDEPTAALDTRTGLGIMHLLRELAEKQGRAVVIVTHDHRLESFADRVVRVEDGRVGASTVLREVA